MHIYICRRLSTNMKYFIIILCVCSVLVSSVQCKAPYKLKVTRAEIARCNKEYIEARVWITMPDRYTKAMNAEFYVHNLPRDTKFKIRMFEFLSNEYRPFAISIERHFCDFIALEYKTMMYPDFIRLGARMPEPKCPVKPGNYSVINYIPDLDNYPPGLLFRNFMLTLEGWHGPVELGLLKVYGILDRDAVIREQFS